jgi:hypothetical protein
MATINLVSIVLIFLVATTYSSTTKTYQFLIKPNFTHQQTLLSFDRIHYCTVPPFRYLKENKLISIKPYDYDVNMHEYTHFLFDNIKKNISICIANHANFDIVLYATHTEKSN